MSKLLNKHESQRTATLSTSRTLDVNKSHKIKTTYGTCLAASLTLEPGSLIINLHKPNLLLIEKDSLQNVCSFCISEKPSLKRCSGCKVSYYCSTRCQNAHWKESHSQECKVLKKLPAPPPTAVRALITMLLRKEGGMEGEEDDWKALKSHVGELKGEVKRWEEIVLQARAGVEFTKAGAGRMEETMMWLCVLSTNAIRITLPDNTPVGLCFSPTLARANHSCNPNAFIVFDSRKVSLRALRTIKKDEQIFISYIDPTEGLAQRQAALKQRYFFTCKCERCEGDENAYQHFLRYRDEVKEEEGARRMDTLTPVEEFVKTAERCQASLKQNPPLTSTSSSQSLTLLKQNHVHNQIHALAALSTLSPLHTNQPFALPPYPSLLHSLYLSYIDTKTFTPALITLLFLFLSSDIYMYPQPHHPVRVVRLYTIAKLIKHIASLNPTELLQDISVISIVGTSSAEQLKVKDNIAKIFQGMDLITTFHVVIILVWDEARKSHGEESAFVKEVEAEIRDVEEVQILRGGTGEVLRAWMGDGGDVRGRREAEQVGGEWRALAGLMGGILGW